MSHSFYLHIRYTEGEKMSMDIKNPNNNSNNVVLIDRYQIQCPEYSVSMDYS
jgi:hypothetical protein